jgi:hypothetical protein
VCVYLCALKSRAINCSKCLVKIESVPIFVGIRLYVFCTFSVNFMIVACMLYYQTMAFMNHFLNRLRV